MRAFDIAVRFVLIPGIGLAAFGVLVHSIVKDWRRFVDDLWKTGSWKV